MTPVGHCGVALLVAAPLRARLSTSAVVLGAWLPDVDFVFVGFSWFNAIHRVWTHNVFFVALAAIIGAGLARPACRGILAQSLALGGVLHLLVDACFDGNPTNGTGVALFWPLSSSMISPFNLMSPTPEHGWGQPIESLVRTLIQSWWEWPLLLSAWLIWRAFNPGDKSSALPSRRRL